MYPFQLAGALMASSLATLVLLGFIFASLVYALIPPFSVDSTHYVTPAGHPGNIHAGHNTGAPPENFDPRPVAGDFDGVAATALGADKFVSLSTFLPIMLMP